MPERINAGMITAGDATSTNPCHNLPQPEIGCRCTSAIVTAGLVDGLGVFEFMALSGERSGEDSRDRFLCDI